MRPFVRSRYPRDLRRAYRGIVAVRVSLLSRPAIFMFLACALFVLVAPMATAADTVSLPVLRAAQLNDASVLTPAPASMNDGSLDRAFQPLVSPRLSASRDHDLWYRLELSANWTQSQPPVLSFKNTQGVRSWGHIWVYAPPTYQAKNLQWLSTGSNSGLSRYTLAELLPVEIRADQPVYVRIAKSRVRANAIVALSGLSAFLDADLNHARLLTAFESVQAAMFLIGLLLWLLLRDRLFIYFCGYIGAQLLFAMLNSGEMFQLPGKWIFAALHGRESVPFAMLTAVFAISFIIEFCDLLHSTPRMAAVFGALRWPLLATTPLILYLPGGFDWWVTSLVNWLILLGCVVGIASVLVALTQGNRQARFFFVAWLPLLAFTIFRVLQLQAGWDQPAWIEFGFQFSMAFATLVITVGLADLTMRARRERDIADQLAHRDPLTGVFNRRAVLSRLDAAITQAERNKDPLALLFLDIDHFKTVNDTYGHAAGDHCLQGIVETIGRELRDEDWIGRYGGEEFVVVLPNTDSKPRAAPNMPRFSPWLACAPPAACFGLNSVA